jgi:hypothetical protein
VVKTNALLQIIRSRPQRTGKALAVSFKGSFQPIRDKESSLEAFDIGKEIV